MLLPYFDRSDAAGPTVVTGSCAIAGAGSLVLSAMLIIPASASPAGVGGLSVSGRVEVHGSATIAASGGASGSGLVVSMASATMQGQSSSTAAGMVEVHGSATLAGSGGLEASGESLGSHGQGDPPPGEWSESYFGGAGGGFSPEAIAAARAAFAEMELQQEEEDALLSMVDL